ncbi:MAG: response regulator, partial [Planctomycetota bacterium]|nr:response regulator [Planctomycetota bacterium]
EFLGMKGACPFCSTTIQLPTAEALENYEGETPRQHDAAPAASRESTRQKAPDDLKGITVLVVEDDPLIAKWLTRMLEARKAKVLYAKDGPKAVRLARQAMPDVVLLDLGLPTMDGYEVMEKLEGIYKQTLIPVIVVTASSPGQVRQRALECGAREIMQKPVAAPALESAIHKVMGN